jgi:hypothetical protein
MSSVVFTSEPYTPWSDNNRWAALGIPSPLIMSSPSIHFHTQFLTAETMDPAVFRRAGIPAAVALYEIADAGVEEALCMAMEVAARSIFRLRQVTANAVRQILALSRTPRGKDEPEAIARRTIRKLCYLAERDAKAIASTKSLMPFPIPVEVEKRLGAHIFEVEDTAEQEVARIMDLLALVSAGEE